MKIRVSLLLLLCLNLGMLGSSSDISINSNQQSCPANLEAKCDGWKEDFNPEAPHVKYKATLWKFRLPISLVIVDLFLIYLALIIAHDEEYWQDWTIAQGVKFIRLFVWILNGFKYKSIVFVGLPNSGKTTLFYQLRDGSSRQDTPASENPNIDTFVLSNEVSKNVVRPVRVIDVPGPFGRRPEFGGYLYKAAGIVFIVDASGFIQDIRATAEYLDVILSTASVVKQRIPIVIVCNKADKAMAHSREFIRKQLEREIEKLRNMHGKRFAFSQCRNEVTFAEASGLMGQISEVEVFIRRHVPV